MLRLAITGATGFVGSHILARACALGHNVRALTRRAPDPASPATWIPGDLADAAALRRLCAGVDVVIHIAGVINAPTRADFFEGNVAGTEALVDAARKEGVGRFVHLSSLAAREPDLSVYGASKAEADLRVADSGLDWSIIRPPAIYGPNDRETLSLFRLAAHGLYLAPNHGRASFIQVEDLANLLLTRARGAALPGIHEVDDGAGGYGHDDIAHCLGASVGRASVRLLHVPRSLLLMAGSLGSAYARLCGVKVQLTLDRVRYLSHPDWVSRAVPMPDWQPTVRLAQGMARSAAWYKEAGWL